MEATPERSLARHQRFYRTLLLAYPRAFRQVYGADMVQVFGDRLRAEREDRGRRASLRVWFLTLLDLLKTAPLQRMERKMTREAAFAVLFAALLAVVVAMAAMGIAFPVTPLFLVGLVVTGIVLVTTGAFGKDRSVGARPAGKIGLRDWWVVLAALLGVVEIGAMIAQLATNPKLANVLALVIVGSFGALALAGAWFRTRSRVGGDWMIVIGVLPMVTMWWMVWPVVLALPIMVMALFDSVRGPSERTASA